MVEVNELTLNIAKAEFVIIGPRQRLNVNFDGDINITVNDNRLKSNGNIGMAIDQHFTWSKHTEEKWKEISLVTGTLKRKTIYNNKYRQQNL